MPDLPALEPASESFSSAALLPLRAAKTVRRVECLGPGYGGTRALSPNPGFT